MQLWIFNVSSHVLSNEKTIVKIMSKNTKIILILIFSMILSSQSISTDADSETKAKTTTFYVGGTGGGNYLSIQEAINDAIAGDTIFVYNGTYNENIVIDKAISLIGEDRDNTVIDGNGARDVIYVSADWVNISRFTVKNGSKGISFFSCSNNTITNSTIHNTSDNGVLFSSSSNNQITNCSVYNNSYGIYLSSSSDNKITCCNVTDNTVCGIYIYYYIEHPSNSNIFHHNNFINNSQSAYDPHTNYWDDGIVGNYWSDCDGPDVDADGLGDTSYNISGGNNKDEHPLIEPVGTDTINPKITVTGVENNTYYNTNVTPVITIFDINLNTTTLTLNNVDFTSGTMISEDGTHTLFVQGTDKAGNPAEETITFTIDKIPPAINLTSPANNSVIKPGTNLDFEIADIHLNTTTCTVNDGVAQQFSSPYSINTEDWEEGLYDITIWADDLAGNEASETFGFTLDGTSPGINISGVANGSYYSTNVTPIINISDVHLNASENIITLDDTSFVSGVTVSSEGEHTLYVYAVDKAGNTAEETITFIIDKTEPIISVSGVEDDAYYNTDVTPVIDVSDTNLNTTSITLNGDPFTSGTTIIVGDTYVLVVQAIDKAGNTANKTIPFTIDTTPPTITIAEKSQITTNSSFIVHWSSLEPIQYYEISTDGEKWINVSTSTHCSFTLSKGINTFYVRGTDAAGNTNTTTVTIERTEGKEERMPDYLIYLITIPFVFVVALIVIIAFLKRKIRIRCPVCKTVFDIKPKKRPFKTECPKCGGEGVLR